ncbi:ammonium transporter [Persicirhabdus sediminis]|uniref:Ammonium transporter n=2 Tax=Persicirhabdus sediminis TaxID=454144 RepID=A0A8J7SM99_9BACT|nr:ammonium transporter [Persicirhabdus sediminis]
MLDTEHDDYSDGDVDIIGKAVYKHIQFNGTEGLTENQLAAAESYYDNYLDQPFFELSTVWVLLCAFLVFIMHLGFASIESGMCQRKNTVNILFKNVFIICSGLLLYGVYGFNSMYPTEAGATTILEGIFSFGKPISESINAGNDLSYGGTGLCQTGWADFIFQAMFAATAATIVSGAVAERVKLSSFMIFAVLLVGFAYPITGGWKWGGGVLDGMGFYDFAGSSVVHAFGGFAALACVLILGPRKGKYTANGVKPILPSNLPLANIGALLLWFGWFGFNCGSVLSADPEGISYVAITTSFGAASGGLAAILVSWIILKKPDLSMALNGILAGLVGITAGADQLSLLGACLAGGVGGGLVVVAVMFFDKLKIDDPVGAISVHGVCGIWGTLAVGLPFLCKEGAGSSFFVQLAGTAAIGAFAFAFSFIVFYIIKLVMGVRVDESEEAEGLDVAEHGAPAYNE